MFDEIQKQSNYYENKDPYNLSNRSNRTLQNATVHYLGTLTYFVGMRWSIKLNNFQPNTDPMSYTVLNDKINYMLYYQDYKPGTIDDYKKDIISPSGTVFT